jgi:hypothetical protein
MYLYLHPNKFHNLHLSKQTTFSEVLPSFFYKGEEMPSGGRRVGAGRPKKSATQKILEGCIFDTCCITIYKRLTNANCFIFF